MQKFFIFIVLVSVFFTTSCTPPSKPDASASPAAPEDPHFSSKTALITYINCIREKVPAAAGGLNIHLTIINAMSDEQFESSGRNNYKAILSAYSSVGC